MYTSDLALTQQEATHPCRVPARLPTPPTPAGVLQPLRGLSTLHLHQFQSALLAGLPRSTTAVCMSLPGHGLEDSWVVPALGTVQPLASVSVLLVLVQHRRWRPAGAA